MSRFIALSVTASVVLSLSACDTRGERPEWVEGPDGGWAPELQHEARGDVTIVSGTDAWWGEGEIVSFDGAVVVVDTGPSTCDFDIEQGYMTVDTYFDANDTEPQDHDGNVVLVTGGRRVFVADPGEYDVPGAVMPGTVEQARFAGHGDWVATHTNNGNCAIRWTNGADRVLPARFCGGDMVADTDTGTVWLASGADVARIDIEGITVYPQAAEQIAWDASNGHLLAASGDTVSAYDVGAGSLDVAWNRTFEGGIQDFAGGADTAIVLTRSEDESEVTILSGQSGEEVAGFTTWQRLNKVHGSATGDRFAVRGVNALHTFQVGR